MAAMVAPSEQYLWLGGFLSSAMSMLGLVGLCNMFFHSEAIFSASLYLGLLVYCGYALYDTQQILKKVRLGDRRFVEHALTLFIGPFPSSTRPSPSYSSLDFVGTFVRVLIIILELTGKKEKSKSSSRRR